MKERLSYDSVKCSAGAWFRGNYLSFVRGLMEIFFEFFFFVAFEAFIAIDSEIFYSFNALLPSESLIKRSRFISRGV